VDRRQPIRHPVRQRRPREPQVPITLRLSTTTAAIEHYTAAFDVLQTVDDRYPVRVAGFALATLLLAIVSTAGLVILGVPAAARPTDLHRHPSATSAAPSPAPWTESRGVVGFRG
jgi:predicted metal-dependent hydrolase